MNAPLAPAVQAQAQPSSISPWPVFWIASVAVFLVSIDVTVLYAAFPALQRAFPEAGSADLSWVLNAYTLVFAALLVPAGRLADLRGRKRMFLLGLAIFLGGSLGCGLAGHVATLIAMRAAQGAGAALLLPASLSILLAAFPPSKRAIAVSSWGAVSGLAGALGPSLGSFLVDHFGWPWAFFLNLPLGIIMLWRGWRMLDESRDPERGAPIDVMGVALLILGVGAITFGLVQSEAVGWTSPMVTLSIAGGLATLMAFVAWARTVRAPAIDLSLFQDRTYCYINLASLCFAIGFAMMFFQTFLFTTGVWSYSLTRAGLAGSPGPLLVVPTAIVCGRFAARAGHKLLLVSGSLIFTAGSIWFALVPGVNPDYVHAWLPGALLTGLGVGMVMPSLSAAAVAHLAPARFGVGSAVNQAVRQMGSVLGVALTVAITGHAMLNLAAFHTLCYLQIAFGLATAILCAPVDTRSRAPAPVAAH
ncbi:EmrB/QacA subfamily drug resistance transporter [Collimonas sp. PA-H2]|uniref:MFS transporter n=1 Tax=Collimonas sp. PA-H2 TaxID=1881062 RepID=UPI000C019EB9|nr:MFS transporter [Collimonas sp. PA-H2]PFH10057.1 EmrB/QacA subfamily drug resistance transporter [Collimonas sp. PA-H2]